MPKKYPYYFSEQELLLGCKRCLENVRGLLAGAKILNDNVKTQQYGLGLYMYAVEEYGKAILLKNAITGTEEKYQIDAWILGWGESEDETTSHDEKMKVGFDNLPEDCRKFMRGIKVTEALTSAKIETEALTSAKSITIKRGKQRYDKVSVPKSTTGSFCDTTNETFSTIIWT